MSFRLSLLAASALVASSAAHAQLVTVPADVLANLDTRVTQNSGRIDVLAGQVTANTTATAAVDARVQAAAAITAAHTTAITALQTGATAAADQAAALDTRVNAAVTANAATDAKLGTLGAKVTAATTTLADLDTRVTANTAAIATVDAKVADVAANVTNVATKVSDTAAKVATVDAKVADASVRLNGLDARVLAATDATVTLGGRTTTLENQVGTLAPQVVQNTRDIADVDARATAGLSAVSARVTLNDQRDDAQDATLNDHDRRIRTAQSTADTARVETATLRSDVDAGRAGIVRQAGPSETVTVAAASGGTSVAFNGTDGDRRLTGVAAGVASNDAATVGQMNASAADTLAAANGYTDRSIASALASNDAHVERMIAGNNRMLHADIDSSAAGGAALASLPQSIIPGSGMLGASVGGKGNQVAMALGLSKAFNAPHVPVLRAGAAIDTRTGDAVYNAAVGIHF